MKSGGSWGSGILKTKCDLALLEFSGPISASPLRKTQASKWETIKCQIKSLVRRCLQALEDEVGFKRLIIEIPSNHAL